MKSLEDMKVYATTALEHAPHAVEGEKDLYIKDLAGMVLQLLKDADFLQRLQAAGVDNWEGYSEAQESD